MSKYPQGVFLTCHECGHKLGLGTQLWHGHRYCSWVCKTLYRARWWRDWRRKWVNRMFGWT